MNYEQGLPKEIDYIYISRFDQAKWSYDSKPEGGILSNLKYEDLVAILEKKDKKLQKFQSCTEYWLVIREGNYFAGSFDQIEIDLPIKSDFTKVFLLRTKKDELIVLK